MKEVVINESAKYGMAILVLVLCVLGLSWAVKVMWENHKEMQKKMMELVSENTVAFQQLQSSISMLIAILGKR